MNKRKIQYGTKCLNVQNNQSIWVPIYKDMNVHSSVPLLHMTVQRKVAEDTSAPLMYIIQKRSVVFLDARATRRPP